MKNALIVNMGMKSIRCMIIDGKGCVLCNKSLPLYSVINDNIVEQDPKEWWEKAKTVIKLAVKTAGNPFINYVSVTSSASCLVCVDENKSPLLGAMMVSDKRAKKESDYIKSLQEFFEVKKETNLEISASLMLPKILWVKNNKPDIFNNTRYFLAPNDFLVLKLCGAFVTDNYNAYKLHYSESNGYPNKLLQKIGIDIKRLPEVQQCGVSVGKIYDNLSDELNISKDAQIVLSSYDAVCSFIGSGAINSGEAADVSGTVTVFRALSENIKKQNNKVYNIQYMYNNKLEIVGGSNNLGGGLIEWLKQCFYIKEEYAYEIMEKEAVESDVGAKGLVFLPYLLGERAPLWDDNARGAFFGIERFHTRKDMARAVFESTGYLIKDMMMSIENSGVKVNSVRLSGGLSRINFISQLKADIIGKQVFVLQEFETTALGSAIMVFVGQGDFESVEQACSSIVKIRMIINPDFLSHNKYCKMFELYKSTYECLGDLYLKRLEIMEKIKSEQTTTIENL